MIQDIEIRFTLYDAATFLHYVSKNIPDVFNYITRESIDGFL